MVDHGKSAWRMPPQAILRKIVKLYFAEPPRNAVFAIQGGGQ